MNAFRAKRVLITGGLGFIGSSLARALVQQGAEVTVLDALIPEYGGNPFNVHDVREQLKIVLGDMRDVATLQELVGDQDVIFNLAAQTSHAGSMEDPNTDLQINVTAQVAMLEACRRVNPEVRIVFTSTRQIYGKPDYLPVDERHPVRPVDVNGINKHAAEWYHLLYGRVYGLRPTILRLTNTYGPGMRIVDARQTFVGVWIRSLIESTSIKVFGDGQQRRDLIYVQDCVSALLMAGADPTAIGKVYNLGTTDAVSLLALAQLLCEVGGEYGLHGGFELVPFPPERKAIDIGDYYGNSDLISRELGWYPTTSLRSGLAQSIAYYRQYRGHYVPA